MELEAIIRGLQATRDIGTNIQALNAFRRSLAASPDFLNDFLARSTFDVFQHIWDAQISHKDHGVTVTLLLCIADILGTSSSHHSTSMKTAADYLATTTLSRRLKPLYFLLSSESKGRINAALTLLAALVSFSPSTAAHIIRTFDFTLSALPSIARPVSKKNNYNKKAAAHPPPTSQHNETTNNNNNNNNNNTKPTNSTGTNALSNQWKDPDPLKRPTRANFIKFALALLKASSPQPLLLSALITQHRQVTGGMLHHLASDPPEVQYRVLNRLQKTVFLAESCGLAPVSKAAVFTDAAMSQLTAIASSSTNGTINIAEEEKEEEKDDAGELAKDILLMACCQPSLGLCDNATSETPPLYAIKGAFRPIQLSSGMKTLYRWLRILRPSDSAVQGDLLDSCIQSNPVLATAMLSSPSLPWSLDQPAASRRWLANATSTHILLCTIANYNSGILPVDENNTINTNGGGGLSSGIVREIISLGILPPIRIISRSALSRGVQHSNALVKHSTLCLLCSALDVSLKLIRELEALGLVDVADKVRQMVRGLMPDPQSVLAVLLSNNSNSSNSSGGGGGDHKEEEDDEGNNNNNNNNDDNDNDTKFKSSKMMLVGMCLKTFVKWQNVLPTALMESSIDVERLVPCHLAALPPNIQCGYLELIGQVATTTSSKSMILITSTTPLVPILQVLVNPAVSKEVCRMAVEVLTQRLVATGGFEKMYEDEAQLYFQALNVVEWKEETMASLSSGEVAPGLLTFLCEAVLLLMRRPHDIYEQTMQHITASNGAAVAQSSSSFSLLGPCLLRQALRVLPSKKTNIQDRLAIAAYTKSVLTAILQQQYIDVKPYASVLLGIIKDEAARQQEQLAKVNVNSTSYSSDCSGSVVLPEEGRQLSELEELLHTFTGGRRYDIDSKPREHKKKKIKLSNGHHHHRHQENNGSSPQLLIKIASSPTTTSNNRLSPPPSRNSNMHVCWPMMAPFVESLAFEKDDAKVSQHLATLLNTVLQPKNNNAFIVYHVLRHCLFWLSQHTTTPSRQLEKTNIEALFVVIKACMSISIITTTTRTNNDQVKQEVCLAIISSSPVILSTLHSTTDDDDNDDAISNLIHYGVVSVLKSLITASQSQYLSSVYNIALVKCLVDGFIQQLRKLSDSSKDEAAARGGGGEAPRCVCTFIELLPLIPRQDIKAATEQALQLVSIFNSGNNSNHYHWLLNATASLLEQQQQQQGGGEGDTTWIQDTVLPILCQSLGSLHPSPLDTVLARMLSNPRIRATFFSASNTLHNNDKKQGYSQGEMLLKAAIEVPTEERCIIAIAVLKQYPSHVEAVTRELTGKVVECSYDADGTEKKKKKKKDKGKKKHKTKADGEQQKDCMVYLPLCVYILKQQRQPASSSIVEDDKESSAARVELANAVATVLHSYFTNTKSDSTSNSFDAGIMKRYAVAALTASLQASPSSVLALLQQLTAASNSTNEEEFIAALMPKEGWTVSRNDEEEDCSSADNCEKASLALTCLATSTSVTSSQLLPYIAAFSSTLGRVYTAGLGDKKKVATSAVTPSSSSSSPSSFLERVLMQGLDGSLGDAVAALSLEQRSSTEAFIKLAHIACCKLAPEILKHRSSDVSSICTLRRFIAALLPEEQEWTEKDHHYRQQQKEGIEEAVGRSAMHLLELLTCHSQFLPTLQCTADSPAPLAPAAQALPRPLESIILVLATDECIHTSTPTTIVEEKRKHLKRDYCELMQTLLDLALLAPQSSAPFNEAVEVCKHWLPVIMAAYGGSLSISDKAVWSLARLLNTTVYTYSDDGDDTAMVDVNNNQDIVSLLDGPLAKSGYVWGPEALKQLSKKKKERSADDDDCNGAYVDVLSKIDPVRCGLTVALYPEECTLLGGGGGGGEGQSIETIATTSAPNNSDVSVQQPPYATGGYDPSFILPLSLFLLKSKAVEPRHFVQLGLLSVTLRCLASADAPLRAMAYEIVALYKQQLMDDECNFKEKQQLTVVLNALQVAITTPFPRLSSCHAVFLAEAATLALNPGHPMFSPVNKYLLKQYALDLSDDIPLFNRMMLSGSQQSREERTWLLSLLISGLRSSEDAYLYKKKHVVELVMSLHDALPADSASVSLCFQLIRRLPFVPRAAKFVFDTCGGSSWLGAVVCKSIVTAMTGNNNIGNNESLSTALGACGTLYNLTQLKSVMRGPGSWLGAAHDLMVVSRNILHTILSLHSADQERYDGNGTSTSTVSYEAIGGNQAVVKECIINILRVMLAAGRHRRSGGLGAGVGAGEVQELEDGFIVVRRSGDGSRNNTHSGSTMAHDDARLIEVLNALYEIAD